MLVLCPEDFLEIYHPIELCVLFELSLVVDAGHYCGTKVVIR